MVTSTPPLGASNPPPANGSVGFQPTQQSSGGGAPNPTSTPNPLHQQIQLLMYNLQQRHQMQQQPVSPILPHNIVNPVGLRQAMMFAQVVQQYQQQQRQQQEHGAAASMLNSPIPGDLSLQSLASYQTSTPLINTDSSRNPTQLSSFLSPQPPTQSAFNSTTSSSDNTNSQSSDSFQTPLSVLNNTTTGKPQRRRNRPGGTAVKTAEVWRFFKPRTPPEQAATCDICNKIIKATNSSTTGMIRHLRSCHPEEYAVLEKARNYNNVLKTLSACPDEKSRENLLNALSASGGIFGQAPAHSTTSTAHLADSSTASSVSPNSTASSSHHHQLLMQNTSSTNGMHSIDSLLVDSSMNMHGDGVEEKASNSTEAAPPPASFTTPKKYMASVKTTLTQMEHKAKSAMVESRHEEEEEDEQDEDVENHLAEEDSEEDASLLSKPKRQKLDDGQSKEYQEQSKSIKQHVDNAEKIIALMLLLDELSPDVVDQPGFRLLVRHLAPSLVLPSAADFKSRILPLVRNQLPNRDINAYRQQLLDNNRSSHSTTHPTTQWPISPSTTAESGFEEFLDVQSETASSASLHIVEQSIRSAQNISQSFGFSTPITHGHQHARHAMKKPKLVDEEQLTREQEMTHVKAEQLDQLIGTTPAVKHEQ